VCVCVRVYGCVRACVLLLLLSLYQIIIIILNLFSSDGY
jgi:hypothetical protein